MITERRRDRPEDRDQPGASSRAYTLKPTAYEYQMPLPLPNVSGTENEALPAEVKRFTDKSREAFLKNGFAINVLTGQSIWSLKKGGRKFWATWHEDQPKLEALTSIRSEVAINPNQLWIPGSNNLPLKSQMKMIEEFCASIGERIPDADAIMGELADYTDLAFSHLDRTGQYLFDARDGNKWARTNTPTVNGFIGRVGCFKRNEGLGVSGWFADRGSEEIFAVPLFVPSAA